MRIFFTTLTLLLSFQFLLAQDSSKLDLRSSIQLKKLSKEILTKYKLQKQNAYLLAKKSNLDTLRINADGSIKRLLKFNDFGNPIYLQTLNNSDAAITTNTHHLYPNGDLSLNITGSSQILANRLALWDGGAVLRNHQELIGRIVQIDTATVLSDHATHVSGTLIAKGINPVAKGMAYNAPNLLAFDFDNDIFEATEFSNQLLISNHSYGYLAGWNYVSNDNFSRWEWYGEKGKNEDYKFGFYDQETAYWDNIAYLSPYYLQVKSAGNSRSSNGPPIGSPYYVYDNTVNDFVLVPERQMGISNNDNYDIIAPTNTGKNILTVGAVFPIVNEYQQPSDVKISRFSSWGPTDDGRVKPDIVADGMSVYSSSSKSSSAYAYKNGTSMAAPNVSGSLLLLQELFAQKNNNAFMLSSTLRGLAIHTAAEAGDFDGPDYIFGWGLLNTKDAAKVILDNKIKSLIIQDSILDQQSKYYSFDALDNSQQIKITICWTDPSGEPSMDGQIDNKSPKLVNDLDLRLYDNKTIYFPWILNPDKPEMPAKKGNNSVDNVEQIVLNEPNLAGKNFILSVSSNKPLKNNKQVYSIIITGNNGDFKPAIITEKINVSVYPNPASNEVKISFLSLTEKALEINIFNTLGTKVYQSKSIAKGIFSKSISTQNYNDGVYFVELILDGSKTYHKLLIKK